MAFVSREVPMLSEAEHLQEDTRIVGDRPSFHSFLCFQQGYGYIVYTNATIGTGIGWVNATYADTGSASNVTYTMTGDTGYFTIDPTTVREH